MPQLGKASYRSGRNEQQPGDATVRMWGEKDSFLPEIRMENVNICNFQKYFM